MEVGNNIGMNMNEIYKKDAIRNQQERTSNEKVSTNVEQKKENVSIKNETLKIKEAGLSEKEQKQEIVSAAQKEANDSQAKNLVQQDIAAKTLGVSGETNTLLKAIDNFKKNQVA